MAKTDDTPGGLMDFMPPTPTGNPPAGGQILGGAGLGSLGINLNNPTPTTPTVPTGGQVPQTSTPRTFPAGAVGTEVPETGTPRTFPQIAGTTVVPQTVTQRTFPTGTGATAVPQTVTQRAFPAGAGGEGTKGSNPDDGFANVNNGKPKPDPTQPTPPPPAAAPAAAPAGPTTTTTSSTGFTENPDGPDSNDRSTAIVAGLDPQNIKGVKHVGTTTVYLMENGDEIQVNAAGQASFAYNAANHGGQPRTAAPANPGAMPAPVPSAPSGAPSVLTAPPGVVGPLAQPPFVINGVTYWIMADGRVFAKGTGGVYKQGDYDSAEAARKKLHIPK